MSDAKYCPKCGGSVPEEDTEFKSDLLLDRYRTEFVCPSCGYHGEVIRHGTVPNDLDRRGALANSQPGVSDFAGDTIDALVDRVAAAKESGFDAADGGEQ